MTRAQFWRMCEEIFSLKEANSNLQKKGYRRRLVPEIMYVLGVFAQVYDKLGCKAKEDKSRLENSDDTIYAAKTKALIS